MGHHTCDIIPKRCTAARAPFRQTRRVAANKVRARVAPRKGADLFLFYFRELSPLYFDFRISKRDMITLIVTPHPIESHLISPSPYVDRGVVGHIDTHTHTHTRVPTEEIFLRRRVRLDIRVV